MTTARDLMITAMDEPANGSVRQGELSLAIWTTTPWTLPANQAVAISEDLDYVLIKFTQDGKQKLVVSEEPAAVSPIHDHE